MSDGSKQLALAITGAFISTSLGMGPGVGWTAGPAIGRPLIAPDPVLESVDDEPEAGE